MRRMTALRLRATFTCRRAAGPFPVLVGVHGGGWVQGARGQFQHWGKYLAARGVALFAISYRLAKPGQKTFPHAVQDVLAAIQYVRGNAKELNIAPRPHRRVRPFRRRQYRRAGGARRARSSPAAIRRTRTPRRAPR